ncbi:MAG: glycosyltransferase [Chloroflexi bacterium]|nr:glycosyltransferase [Chloroflexota bacterium]
MTEVSPLVSIIIPAYNNRRTICDAVDSALAQTHPRCEIVVVDDGSTDGTRELLQERYGDRIQIIHQANAGPAAARNAGLWRAQGDYVNYLDGDDLLASTKIARCLEVIDQQQDSVIVYTGFQFVAADGVTPLPAETPPAPSGDIFCDLLLGSPITIHAPLVPRQALIDVGGMNEDLQQSEDRDLWVRLAQEHDFLYVDEPLTMYRLHDDALHVDVQQRLEGRLMALQLARYYPKRQACYDDATYDHLVAGTHHQLAVVYWQHGARVLARGQLRSAQALAPSAMRRVLLAMSYAFPARAVTWLERVIGVVKGRRQSGTAG